MYSCQQCFNEHNHILCLKFYYFCKSVYQFQNKEGAFISTFISMMVIAFFDMYIFILWITIILYKHLFQVIFLVILKQYQPVTYLGYVYPEYVVIIGIFISLIPVAPLPIGMVMAYLSTSGTFFEVIIQIPPSQHVT